MKIAFNVCKEGLNLKTILSMHIVTYPVRGSNTALSAQLDKALLMAIGDQFQSFILGKGKITLSPTFGTNHVPVGMLEKNA